MKATYDIAVGLGIVIEDVDGDLPRGEEEVQEIAEGYGKDDEGEGHYDDRPVL